MYIRYRQTKLIIELGEIDLSHRWNKAATWCGVLACFGMSLVANFQETAVPVMHFLGAVFAFFIGSIYFVLQARIMRSDDVRSFFDNFVPDEDFVRV